MTSGDIRRNVELHVEQVQLKCGHIVNNRRGRDACLQLQCGQSEYKFVHMEQMYSWLHVNTTCIYFASLSSSSCACPGIHSSTAGVCPEQGSCKGAVSRADLRWSQCGGDSRRQDSGSERQHYQELQSWESE